MDRDQFSRILAEEGYAEILTVDRPPNAFLELHRHSFEAKALVLEGEIRLRIGSNEQVYKPGQQFHLHANEEHSETYGPDGVRYLVGRK